MKKEEYMRVRRFAVMTKRERKAARREGVEMPADTAAVEAYKQLLAQRAEVRAIPRLSPAAEARARRRCQLINRAKNKPIRDRALQWYRNVLPELDTNDIAEIESRAESGCAVRHVIESAVLKVLCRRLRKNGWESEHTSKYNGKASSRYFVKNGKMIRVSDHSIPETAQRESDRMSGYGSRWCVDWVVNTDDAVAVQMAEIESQAFDEEELAV